jgi:alpha(1,3/1,4) fucosyltransferase
MCFKRAMCLRLFFCIIYFQFCFPSTVYIVPFGGFDRTIEESSKFDSGLFGKLKKAINILGYQCKFISLDYVSNIHNGDLKYLILLNFHHTRLESKALSYREYLEKMLNKFKRKKLVLMCFEPESVEPENHDAEVHKLFGKVITCYDSFKGELYHKFYYPLTVLDLSSPRVPFQNRGLATLINCCKVSNHPNEIYSERLNVIKFFENMETDDFKFYGIGWDKRIYKNYGGNVSDKIETLRKYRFCYCFENTKNVTGYITEKIIDCFNAGCVPIYWGATNIDWYIPKNCYILREDFATLQDIYSFIKNMPENQYQEYLNNIKKYLSSDAALLFSYDNFIDSVLKALFPGYNRLKIFNENEMVNLKKVDSWISLYLSKRLASIPNV